MPPNKRAIETENTQINDSSLKVLFAPTAPARRLKVLQSTIIIIIIIVTTISITTILRRLILVL